jgi:predicted dehydrogenase
MDDRNGHANGKDSQSKPRLAIIGAGSRGNAYARATFDSGLGIVAAVVEPIEFKRKLLGSKFIWHKSKPTPEQEFSDYHSFIKFLEQQQKDKAAGTSVSNDIDGVFVCVRDELHKEVVTALAPLGLHIMCEKPLATSLKDCLDIQRSLQAFPPKVFAIGHVLRYSPHNLLLRQLVLEEKVIGDVLSVEHVEPVGWWHFSHSYVRGSWRKESTTAPSLLTKSCHDVDWILWMLGSPPPGSNQPPHLPNNISAAGSLKQFRRSRKPKEAGDATNCLSCPIRNKCMYSAPRIYWDGHLAKGNARWPVEIVNPEIETILAQSGVEKAKEALLESLAEDYDARTTPVQDIESRPWYGRCVWESDNDVCDDQHVLFQWDDDDLGRTAKTASFHMIAQTLAQCERRGWIYGTTGEINYDSTKITLNDFENNATKEFLPEVPKNSHHGGGDDGLTQQFVKAVAAVKSGSKGVQEAQVEYLGVTLEEAVRSHAAVFAAEEARIGRKVVNWKEWWETSVEAQLNGAV